MGEWRLTVAEGGGELLPRAHRAERGHSDEGDEEVMGRVERAVGMIGKGQAGDSGDGIEEGRK